MTMATSDDELRSALSLIESERVRRVGGRELSVDEIMSMGGVEYVSNHIPDSMKKRAHELSMPRNEA